MVRRSPATTQTAVADNLASTLKSARRHGRKMGWVLGVTILVAASTAPIVTAVTLDHRYGPVQQGGFGGTYSDNNFVSSKDGFSYSLVPTPGASGQLLASLSNLGSHSVKVVSIDTDNIVTAIQWSVFRDGRTILGADTPWQSFPALVPPHGVIRPLITIHHPSDCSSQPANAAGRYYGGFHTVHWQSLLHDHTSLFDDGLGERSIGIC